MRWIVFVLLIKLCPCLGMYAGNAVAPDMPETGLFSSRDQNTSFRLDYTYDHTLSAPVKFSAPGSTKWLFTGQTNVKKQGANVGASFGNQVTLYASLGHLIFNPSGVMDHFELHKAYRDQVYFGGGGHIILVFFRQCTMGIDAKYHASSQMEYDSASFQTFKGLLHNWQLSFTLGREFGWFNPYVGFAFQTFRSTLHEQQAPSDWAIKIEEQNPWLCVLGLALVKNKMGYLNVEGRLIGEFAVALRASLSF